MHTLLMTTPHDTQEPLAFIGGFVAGILDLNITHDPLSTWIATEAGTSALLVRR